VRGLSATWAQNDIGARLMAALENSAPMTPEEMPARDDRKPGLGKDGALVADLLKLLLKIRSRDIDVASRLLARSEDLEALAAGQRDGLAILTGWRFEQFGRDALDLVEGRLGFTVNNGKLMKTRTAAVEPAADLWHNSPGRDGRTSMRPPPRSAFQLDRVVG